MDETIAFRVADQLEESARLLRALATALREARSKIPPAPALGLPVESLGLGARARRAFVKLGIRTLGDLTETSLDDLFGVYEFGVTSGYQVRGALAKQGLCLRGDKDFLLDFQDGRPNE